MRVMNPLLLATTMTLPLLAKTAMLPHNHLWFQLVLSMVVNLDLQTLFLAWQVINSRDSTSLQYVEIRLLLT
jgi:uncharacterized membrane protein YqjE